MMLSDLKPHRLLTQLSRVWRWREPVLLGRIEDWPQLIEGDYYRSITGEYYEIRRGRWAPKKD